MYSLLTAPLFSNGVGTISACASSTFQPTPQPTTRRPWESWSIVARILAASIGFLYGRTITDGSSRALEVWPATKAITDSTSRVFCSVPTPGISPLGP